MNFRYHEEILRMTFFFRRDKEGHLSHHSLFPSLLFPSSRFFFFLENLDYFIQIQKKRNYT
jgi:hypothetical protein